MEPIKTYRCKLEDNGPSMATCDDCSPILGDLSLCDSKDICAHKEYCKIYVCSAVEDELELGTKLATESMKGE